MTTKEKLLTIFEENRDVYYSGEQLAKELSISRAAVWKAMQSLRAEGYAIDALPNKGYCLSGQNDILSAQGICKYLQSDVPRTNLTVLPVVTSTNTLLREQANSGAPEGTVVIAGTQTAGRGRHGHTFFSPESTGLYLSLLLRPHDCPAQQAVRLTTMAAVAMCEAVEAVSGETASIKWVNDIFVGGKKVCGILTEGAFGLESGVLDYAVLGLGVNLYEPAGGFPPELRPIAGAAFHTRCNDGKNRLAAEFLNRFYPIYNDPCQTNYVERYRARSFVIGREVTLLAGETEKTAVVDGIDDECRLLVRYRDGSVGCYASGEISVRV